MFCKSSRFLSHLPVVAGVFVAVLSASVMAGVPSPTGLGQSWPNATDVSASPHYHVYVFVRDGIRYIQINDLNGIVHGAVAEADNAVLVLPLGVDASYVTTSHSNSAITAAPATNTTETVYSDSATQVTATTENSGVVLLHIITPDICTNPEECDDGEVVKQAPVN